MRGSFAEAVFPATFLHQATVDYRRCSLTEPPASRNRDDHLVRTLVAAPLPRPVPPHRFGVERRLRQPQRLLQADFVLQPRRCLSLADNALSLSFVTLHSLFLPGEARVELNIVW